MKICQVKNCNSPHIAKGYCKLHYYQIKRTGKILTRTNYTPNEIKLKNKHAIISLYNMKCDKIAETIIDIQDVLACSKHKWYLGQKGYVTSRIDGKLVYLHKYLTGFNLTDHRDGNPLNNTRENMRESTHLENMFNRKGRIATSKYKGVWLDKRRGTWQSGFRFLKKYYHVGSFINEEDAFEAYKLKSQAIAGELANTRVKQLN